jgi:hypothetical protein
VNRPVDATTARECRVRCIHDRVNLLAGDVTLHELDAAVSEFNQHD